MAIRCHLSVIILTTRWNYHDLSYQPCRTGKGLKLNALKLESRLEPRTPRTEVLFRWENHGKFKRNICLRKASIVPPEYWNTYRFYMYVSIHMHKYISENVYINANSMICESTCTNSNQCMCMFIKKYIFAHIHICIHITYIYLHVYIYIYIHITFIYIYR